MYRCTSSRVRVSNSCHVPLCTMVVVVLQHLEVSNNESLGERAKLQRELYGIHQEIVAPCFIYNNVHS